MSYAIPTGVVYDEDGGGGGGDTYEPNFISLPFAYGDVSPATIGSVPANKDILSVDVYITQAFNGTGAALQVGVSGTPADLVSSAENNPAMEALYSIIPNKVYGSTTNIIITITPGAGASAGAGIVLVTFEP